MGDPLHFSLHWLFPASCPCLVDFRESLSPDLLLELGINEPSRSLTELAVSYTVTTIDNDHGRSMSINNESSIGAGDFKTACLKLLDDVARNRKPLVITKHGKPVAKLVPMPPDVALFGALAGSVLREDDIDSPLDVDWDAAP